MALNINIDVDTSALRSLDLGNRFAQRLQLVEKEEEKRTQRQATQQIQQARATGQLPPSAAQVAAGAGDYADRYRLERLKQKPAARRYETLEGDPFFYVKNVDQASIPGFQLNYNYDNNAVFGLPVQQSATHLFAGVEVQTGYVYAWSTKALSIAVKYLEYISSASGGITIAGAILLPTSSRPLLYPGQGDISSRLYTFSFTGTGSGGGPSPSVFWDYSLAYGVINDSSVYNVVGTGGGGQVGQTSQIPVLWTWKKPITENTKYYPV